MKSKASVIGMAPQRASYVDDGLKEVDRTFLDLVRESDVEGIRELLENNDVSVDCCDYRGQRALDIAVSHHDEELVAALLSMLEVSSVHMYSAVLQAVVGNDAEILKILLQSANSRKYDDQFVRPPELQNTLQDIATTSLTPIMAAAINGDVEICRILLDAGHFVHKPHNPKCICSDQCAKRNLQGENLTQSINRMNSYRALASPVYIILTSDDPVLTAFELSKELRLLSTQLSENQREYEEIAKNCSKFAADILDQCRDTNEVKTVLSQRKGFFDPRFHRFSRLHLAVQYGQKEFVTHPSCQQVLRSMWVEGLGSWWSWSQTQKALHVCTQVFMTPFVSIAHVGLPRAKVILPLRVPLNRFIYHVASYVTFLVLLLVTLLHDRRYDLLNPATWSEVAVFFWVVGHCWATATKLFSMGWWKFSHSWWEMYDLLTFGLFLLAEFLWLSAYFLTQHSNTDRMRWKWYHPFLVGEGIYSIASVLAFSRLLLWYHTHSQLGPLGTSLQYMISDVLKFFLLFFILMFAFATGINSIYKNYKQNDEDDDNGQPVAFSTLTQTFKSLFWAIFGMGEPDYAMIVVNKNGLNGSYEEHFFSEAVGYGMWGVYHLITVVVLLNMLIAMMSETYQRIRENSDIEWKFACSTLWLTIFHSHCLTPPPFNLIPSLNGLAVLTRWTLQRVQGTKRDLDVTVGFNYRRCCYWDYDLDNLTIKHEEEVYQNLLLQLVRRYLHAQEQRQSSSIPVDVYDRLKADIIQELRKTSRASLRRSHQKSTANASLQK